MGSGTAFGSFNNFANQVLEPIGQMFKAPDAPSLQYPDAKSSTPTQAEANTTALQTQLNKESAARASATNETGGSGLLDTPTTTSSVLLGS